MQQFLFSALLLVSTGLCAQTNDGKNEQESIEEVINIFFEALESSDTTLTRSLFHKDASLKTIFKARNGNTVVRSEEVNELLRNLGTPHKETWDERISNLKISIGMPMATAWMDYQFYFNDTFSHCGVNSFRFVKTEDNWKILDIVDTRRKKNCND